MTFRRRPRRLAPRRHWCGERQVVSEHWRLPRPDSAGIHDGSIVESLAAGYTEEANRRSAIFFFFSPLWQSLARIRGWEHSRITLMNFELFQVLSGGIIDGMHRKVRQAHGCCCLICCLMSFSLGGLFPLLGTEGRHGAGASRGSLLRLIMQCDNIRRLHLSSGLLGPVCRRHLSLDSAADTFVSSVICESVGNFRQPKNELLHLTLVIFGGCSGFRCLGGR